MKCPQIMKISQASLNLLLYSTHYFIIDRSYLYLQVNFIPQSPLFRQNHTLYQLLMCFTSLPILSCNDLIITILFKMANQTNLKQIQNSSKAGSFCVFYRNGFTVYRLNFTDVEELTVKAFLLLAIESIKKQFNISIDEGRKGPEFYACTSSGRKRDLPPLDQQQLVKNIKIRRFLLQTEKADILGEKYQESTTIIASDFIRSKYHPKKEAFSPKPARFCCF